MLENIKCWRYGVLGVSCGVSGVWVIFEKYLVMFGKGEEYEVYIVVFFSGVYFGEILFIYIGVRYREVDNSIVCNRKK